MLKRHEFYAETGSQASAVYRTIYYVVEQHIYDFKFMILDIDDAVTEQFADFIALSKKFRLVF